MWAVVGTSLGTAAGLRAARDAEPGGRAAYNWIAAAVVFCADILGLVYIATDSARRCSSAAVEVFVAMQPFIVGTFLGGGISLVLKKRHEKARVKRGSGPLDD